MSPPPEVMREMQGDIWPGLGKSHETFYLFSIANPKGFIQKMKAFVDKGLITNAESALKKRAENRAAGNPSAGINVSFSAAGMKKLGWDDQSLPRGMGLKDRFFKVGARTDALAQGRDDPSLFEGWMTDYVKEKKLIDGLFIICGNEQTCQEGVALIESEFGDSIGLIQAISGDVGPDPHGFEHFGFKDTISQPFLQGWEDRSDITLNYQCRPGVIVMNHKGMKGSESRNNLWEPEWATNGSYFVFRKLEQDVEAFHKRAKELANDKNLGLGMTPEQLEARFVGRWHSGAPVEKYPTEDPGPGHDDNNWDYDDPHHETKCPYGSHIRKCNPRNTFRQVKDKDLSLIMRRGIPYGSKWSESTKNEPRGLLFGCYQSSLQNGYCAIMNKWCNNDGFPLQGSGQDVIVAQPIKGADNPDDRQLHANLYGLENGKPVQLTSDGQHPKEKKKRCDFPGFIKPRGGEYFFTPPMSFLATRLPQGPPAKNDDEDEEEEEE